MRKLTAGIFSVLLGMVAANAADVVPGTSVPAVVSTTYLDQVLESKQDVLKSGDLITISSDNKIDVVTGAVSENGTNLVTAADIYAALNAAVAASVLTWEFFGSKNKDRR